MPARLARLVVLLRLRPRLLASVGIGVVVWLALPQALAHGTAARTLLAWNVGGLIYLALAWTMMAGAEVHDIRRRALRQDDGRWFVLVASILAAAAVLVAVGSQLATVKDMHGVQRVAHAALAGLTVVVSWLFVQTSFALHYAHDFYLARLAGTPDPLAFPGTADPGYGDFLYFACVIGTSAQTADVSFVGSPMRFLGLLHCVIAFFFNVAVLGLTINIAASVL